MQEERLDLKKSLQYEIINSPPVQISSYRNSLNPLYLVSHKLGWHLPWSPNTVTGLVFDLNNLCLNKYPVQYTTDFMATPSPLYYCYPWTTMKQHKSIFLWRYKWFGYRLTFSLGSNILDQQKVTSSSQQTIVLLPRAFYKLHHPHHNRRVSQHKTQICQELLLLFHRGILFVPEYYY